MPCSCRVGAGYPWRVSWWGAASPDPHHVQAGGVVRANLFQVYKQLKVHTIFRSHESQLSGSKPAADLFLDSQLAGWGSVPYWLDFWDVFCKPRQLKSFLFQTTQRKHKAKCQAWWTEPLLRVLSWEMSHSCYCTWATRDQHPLHCFQMQTQGSQAPSWTSASVCVCTCVSMQRSGDAEDETIVKGSFLTRVFLSPEASLLNESLKYHRAQRHTAGYCFQRSPSHQGIWSQPSFPCAVRRRL